MTSHQILVEARLKVTQLTKERDGLRQQLIDERRGNLESKLALEKQLNEKQQLHKDVLRLQRDNRKLHQQLASNGNELTALQNRHSTLQRAYNQSLSQPKQLQSYNIPADDVTILGAKLGDGSYGVVWKGVWREIIVAVKRFHEELLVSEHNRKLFRQELANCAYLHHPNIVTFCGATLEKGNPLQIITELLEGSLDELIKAAVSCTPYLTHGEQVHLAECTAAGITYLHQRQPTPFVHCDIRPSNILVTRDMSAKVGDFGGSHIIGASTSAGPLSINYTAPERIGEGSRRRPSSPSSDVYSLGVTLTELFISEAAVRCERDGQLTMIGNVKLQNLCIEATADVRHKRPTAAQLLVRLQELKAHEEYKSCPVRRLVLGKVEGDAVQLVPFLGTPTQNAEEQQQQQPQGQGRVMIDHSQSKSADRLSQEGRLQVGITRTTGMHGQDVKNTGRNKLQTGATGMYGQYTNAAAGSFRRNEMSLPIANEQQIARTSQQEDLDIGSLVEVKAIPPDPPLYGAIRWIGHVPTPNGGSVKVAGIELDSAIDGGTDGTFQGQRYFKCQDGCGWFVPARHCVRDTRFSSPQQEWPSGVTDKTASMRDRASEAKGQQGGFGLHLAEEIPGSVRYAKVVSDDVCGEFKGIQGILNSSCFDATLFSMFYATYVFDTIFNRTVVPGQKQDVYTELRGILKDRIVNPLRRNHYVRADQVMKLRAKLEKLGVIDGLTHEEKDPEEILNVLLQQVFKGDPYLALRSGTTSPQESYMYQLSMYHDEKIMLATVQRLLEQSFMGGDLKLVKIPQVLILLMPKFGMQFKSCDRIFPSPTLRINDITEGCKRQCVQCEKDAEYECKECSFSHVIEAPCFCASFCDTCCAQIHKHHKRKNHGWKDIRFGQELELCEEGEELELFAVVCIERSHYVSFVKFEDNEWVFFDSMADRRGGQDGYNIPCVTHLPDLPLWLNDPDRVRDTDLRDIPNPIRRMFVDAYMCMYIAPNESMY